MSLTLLPLGVGDAFTEKHFTSCMALEADGQWLLLDCPHPVRRMMADARAKSGLDVRAEKLAGVALTHLHADHASGLEGLGYYFFFALGKKLPLLVHPDVARRLWDGHLAAGMEQLLGREGTKHKSLTDYFELVPLDEARAVTLGAFSVECRKTRHHVPTTALRVTAGGARLGYSADTSFDRALVDWLAQADLVLHETNLGVHTPWADLAALPAELRRRMRLFHCPDDLVEQPEVLGHLREGEPVRVG